LAATPTVSRGVHDSRAEYWCIATKRPAALSCTRCDTVHTQYGRDTHHCQRVGVRSSQNRHQASLDAPLGAAKRARRETSHTRRCWCRRDRARAREAVASGGVDARWGYTMHVIGGRGEWSLGEGAGGYKIWDGQGGVRGAVWGVDGTQREALDAGFEAPYSGGRRLTELIDPSIQTRQLRRHDTNRRTGCGPELHRGVWEMSGAWWLLYT
jgi:hypothetical protein